MLKNIGFFALGIIIAAVIIFAYKKMKSKNEPSTQDETETPNTGGGGDMGGTFTPTTGGGGMG